VRGSVSKYLPPTANNIASRNNPIIRSILALLEIFFEEIVVNFLINK
jgi:hypothetical protein